MDRPINNYWRRYYGWSHSRANLFRECPKRYSFQYLYKWERSPSARLTKKLSKYRTLPLEVGSLVHEAIESFLKALQRDPQASPEPFRHQLEVQFEVLRQHTRAKLLEALFEIQSPDELDQRILDEADRAQGHFDAFLADHLDRYKSEKILSVEELLRHPVGEHQIWVSADLVVEDRGGTLRIADWKTGRKETPAADSIQLTAYIHWAHTRFRTPLEDIEAELVFLESGNVDRTKREAADLLALEERVRVESEAMQSLTDYGQIEAQPDPKHCRLCPFRPLCREDANPLDAKLKKAIQRDLGD